MLKDVCYPYKMRIAFGFLQKHSLTLLMGGIFAWANVTDKRDILCCGV